MSTKKNQRELFVKKYFLDKFHAIFILICLILLGSIINGIIPFLFGIVIDSMLHKKNDVVIQYIIYMIILETGGTLLSSIEGFYGSKITQKISNEMKMDVLNRIVYMKMSRLDNYSKGELINRLEGDTNEIASTYVGFFTGIIQVFISTLISIYFAITLSKELTLLAVAFLPVLYLGTIIFKKSYQRAKVKLKDFSDQYLGSINEIFANFEGVKSFNYQNVIEKKFKCVYQENLELSKNLYKTQAKMSFTQNSLNTLFDAGVIVCATMLINGSKLTIGGFVSFNQYIGQLYQTASQVLSYIMNIVSCQVNIDRINKICSEPVENVEEKCIEKKDVNKIQIKNLTFGYTENKILDDLNLQIENPGFYSIVGINGVGKSTILKLLLGLYESDKGNIFINNKDINDISLYEHREMISYIPKQPFLFNSSIEYNITLGKNIDKKIIEFVCRQVGLYEFIKEQDHGYETIIGEDGIFLSSGTKQKISIARAALKDSTLWLCDEITSDLDGKVEADVINYLKELSREKIIIMVSHKLSSIEKSDKIFVVNRGHIISEGTNAELMEKDLLYRKMFY